MPGFHTLSDRRNSLGVTKGPIRSAFVGFRAALAFRRENANQALKLMEEAKSIAGQNHWSPVAQEYLDIYLVTVQPGTYQPLPCDLDPIKDPDLYALRFGEIIPWQNQF